MPQIKIRGMEMQKICNISKEMIDHLEKIIECPRDYFTIESMASNYILDGAVTEGYPFVEVAWFDRGQQVQDEVAKAITALVQREGYPSVDISFSVFEKNKYYENGEHF